METRPPPPEGGAGWVGVVGGNAVGGGLGDEFAFFLVVAGGKAGALVGGNVEAGVFHAERGEDVVAVEVGQRLAGELFDDVALDVHGHAVDPSCAGLIEERDLRQAVDHLLKVFVPVPASVRRTCGRRACRRCRR